MELFCQKSQLLLGVTVRKFLEWLKEKLRNGICISVSKVRCRWLLVTFRHFKNILCIEQISVAHPAKNIRDFWRVS